MAVQSINLSFTGLELYRKEGLDGRQMVIGRKDTINVNSIAVEEGTCQHCGSTHPAGRMAQFKVNGKLAFSARIDDGDASHISSVINVILNGEAFINAVHTMQQLPAGL